MDLGAFLFLSRFYHPLLEWVRYLYSESEFKQKSRCGTDFESHGRVHILSYYRPLFSVYNCTIAYAPGFLSDIVTDKKGLNFPSPFVIIRKTCRIRISVIQRLPKPECYQIKNPCIPMTFRILETEFQKMSCYLSR